METHTETTTANGATNKRHCFHSTADSLHHWPAGKSQYRCCNCGQYFNVPWRLEERPVEGHGPHTYSYVRIYDWPTTECHDTTQIKEA